MPDTKALLLLPRLRVQNANAISGPLSWGFPSPTAFTGFAHALERRLGAAFGVDLGGVGIVCHRFEPQVSRPAGRRNQVFCLTRNPVGRDGATSALVEEGRAHMEVSLVIEVLDDLDDEDREDLLEDLPNVVDAMRLAGGSILPDQEGDQRRKPACIPWYESASDNTTEFRKLRRRLLPGFALVQRADLLAERLTQMQQEQPPGDTLDALLDLCRLNVEPGEANPKKPDEIPWEVRSRPGWLVPIPVGYAALSGLYPPGEVLSARDPQVPFRFVESLYSLGQWMSPHRLTDLEQLLWQTNADTEAGLYRCINHYAGNGIA
jgi:CRISPR-associated protein Csy2